MKEEFLNRMRSILKEDYHQFIDSYNLEPSKSLQVNTSKISALDFEKLVSFKLKKMGIPNAYYFDTEALGNHPYHHAGLFYIQEPSAMLPPLTVPIKKDAKIADLCAAPGGKTHILANIASDGLVLSNEVNYSRAKKLLSNVERLGLSNVIVSNMSIANLTKIYHNYFDVVLLDAPCSGEGMFRKDKVALKDWSKEKVNQLAKLQKELLNQASLLVKSGGYLIYSTCTFSKEEDEEVIIDFLEKNHFKLCDVESIVKNVSTEGLKIVPRMEKTRRCYPHIFGEGQFMAVLQNEEISEQFIAPDQLEDLNSSEKKTVESFLKENMLSQPFEIKKYHQNIVAVKKYWQIPNLSSLATGVKIGEFNYNRFIPHHHFAKAYGHLFKNTYSLNVTDENIIKYLKGEEIKANVDDGYGVIMVDKYPLGLFKANHGRLKNHYPKGLRLPN